jgi:peptide/nickel transport system permease protein
MREILGLNKPLLFQYGDWLKNFFTGNLGRSFRFGTSVFALVIERAPATLELVLYSVLMAFITGVVLGTISATKRGTWLDRGGTTFSFVGFAIPDFLWGIIFVIVFGAALRLLPASGRLSPGIDLQRITGFNLVDSILTGNLTAFGDSIIHLILPSIALALGLVAVVQRTLRSNLLEVMQEDYIFTDRMKGLPEWKIVLVRAMKNALIPCLTIVGVQFTFLIGGSILIELIFGWPGLGNLAFTAVQYRDLSLIQGIVVIYSIIVVITSFLIDMTYSYLNPKIRYV